MLFGLHIRSVSANAHGSLWTYFCIVLIQKVNDSNVVLESDDVGFGESIERGQISRRGFDGT
jgi:hypothetical protein